MKITSCVLGRANNQWPCQRHFSRKKESRTAKRTMTYCLEDVRNCFKAPLRKEKKLKTKNDSYGMLQCAKITTVVEHFNIIIETNNFLPDQEVKWDMKRVKKNN